MALNWKFVFGRRGLELTDYVSDCQTVGEVLIKFDRDGIEPPSTDEIIDALGAIAKPEPKAASTSTPRDSKPTKEKEKRSEASEADTRLVDTPRQLDDLIIL